MGTLTRVNINNWKSTLRVSKQIEFNLMPRENRQLKMEYKADLDESMQRKQIYEENLYKLYTLLWEKCAKNMQNKILVSTEYDSEMYNNPMKFLQEIKEHSLNYQDTKYKMSIISDAIKPCFNLNQRQKENLQSKTA